MHIIIVNIAYYFNKHLLLYILREVTQLHIYIKASPLLCVKKLQQEELICFVTLAYFTQAYTRV